MNPIIRIGVSAIIVFGVVWLYVLVVVHSLLQLVSPGLFFLDALHLLFLCVPHASLHRHSGLVGGTGRRT